MVNGLNMYYEIHGSGYPLVLIHGGGSSIYTTFGKVLPILAQHHRVIAVDLQAHGHTADIDRATSFEHDADDVAALVKHLGIDKADFIGFSNGGSTTLQIAIRHADIVNKIVVIAGLYKKTGVYQWFWDFMANATFADMPQQLKDAYLEINPDPAALRTMHDRDLVRMQTFSDMNEDDIKNIKVKAALIINGDKDVTTNEHALEMSQQIANAQLAIFPGTHGACIGEITTLKPGDSNVYPAIQIIEEFLAAN